MKWTPPKLAPYGMEYHRPGYAAPPVKRRQRRIHPGFSHLQATLPCLYPDLALEAALRYVNQARLVPVVNRANSRNLEGVICSEPVLKKYRG